MVSKQEARQLPPGEEEPGVCETRPPKLCFSSISRLGSDFVCPDPEGSR